MISRAARSITSGYLYKAFKLCDVASEGRWRHGRSSMVDSVDILEHHADLDLVLAPDQDPFTDQLMVPMLTLVISGSIFHMVY